MFWGKVLLLFSLFTAVGGWCTPFTYGDWHEWESCSRSCGGGTHRRVRYSCVKSDEDWQTDDCNEFCYNGGSYRNGYCHCSRWRSGSCCADCKNIDIPHCKRGRQRCGGSPDNVRCSECYKPYYDAGWGNGCRECPIIAQCVDRHCTNKYNTKCEKCRFNGILFKPTPSKTECERVCAWDKQNCWPGDCVDGLTRNCHCAPGFHKHSGPGETSCQLDESNAPSVSKCFTSVFGPGGKGKQTKASECKNVNDFYGNVQPHQLQYDMAADFKVDISNITQKTFIKESKFGVTDVTLYILKEWVLGNRTELMKKKLLQDESNGTNAVETYYKKDKFDLNVTLKDGERLCAKYEAKGGGYLKTIDISGTHQEKGPYPYRKTKRSQMLCYRYDKASPTHCSATRNCPVGATEPLKISNVISRSRYITVEFKGWIDPVPVHGKAEHTSGIESYLITVHAVSDGLVDNSAKLTRSLNASQTSVIITLPSDSPRLYCIKLEVKDVAENTQQARRFILYDNSTFISTNAGTASFSVSSAVKSNKSRWQTNHDDICLNWTSYFTNIKYETNSFLDPINLDDQIPIAFDQTTGRLPVSGTQNVFGIIEYWFSWSFINGTISKELRVPDFINQTYCRHFNMKDGQTYILNIRAVDIVNNTYSENRTVHIDRTPPHIYNIGLMKDGTRQLFVHDETDLSKMSLSFEALDPHSGLLNIEWWFGTSDAGSELGHGTNGIKRISQDGCQKGTSKCYCPDVGKCEVYNYSISMNKLVDNLGKHNRNYFFTIKVTNSAGLSNIEHVDILVDDSPPESGVIYEGARGTSDIDYTSDSSFIVRWHGFIDHESGIKEYRVGLARACVKKKELQSYDESSNITQYSKIPYTESSFRMTANFTGKMYVSIIAINNAMEASDVVCSDGITRDNSPPDLTNVRVKHGKWSESLYCHNGQAWLFRSDLRKIKLPNITVCNLRCHANTRENEIFGILPVGENTIDNADVGEFMCKNLPLYNLGNIIYLPYNYMYLSWEIDEIGSQIQDFYVGFGHTLSNTSALSVMDYKSTNRKQLFKMNHLGVSAGDLFYAYVKTVNKAKLEKVTEIGPILIDETPPYFNGKPTVHIDQNMVTIGWNKNTISDPEQTSPINQMFFQIVHDSEVVSPLLEWRLEVSKPCSSFTGGCMKYSLKRLQKIDTDLGLNFTVRIYAYNNAGHFATEETLSFSIPSRYPPGHAVVADIDPESSSSTLFRDVDVHFTANKLCAKWFGFRHHENVTVEIGVGVSNITANIIPFQVTNASNTACIKSKWLQFHTRYFVLLRASCSGGETISVSDGIIIANKTDLLNNFEIKVNDNSQEVSWNQQSAESTSQTMLCAMKRLKVGHKYRLVFRGVNRKVSVMRTAANVVIQDMKYNNLSKNMEVHIVPLIERPCITVVLDTTDNTTSATSTENERAIIQDCNTISVTWVFAKYKEIFDHLAFEIALEEKYSRLNTSQYNLVTAFAKSEKHTSHVFYFPSLSHGQVYTVIIRPCTNVRCIGPVYSNTFEIESTITHGKLLSFQIELNNEKACVDVTLGWNKFEAMSSVTIYQWSVSKDKEANTVLTTWRTVASDGRLIYNVTECIYLPVLGHSTLYLCVRAYSTAGNVVTICERASVLDKREFTRDIVFDIDASINSWNVIKKMIHSSNIGSKISALHDAEMDFGTTNTSVVGTLMYATERNVTWYLMKNKHLPVLGQCDKDSECVHSSTTANGYVFFDKLIIMQNILHYTCAYSNASSVTRELFTENMSEIRACSNGFIIDGTPPFGGQINIENSGGYITSSWKVDISWNGFDDNVNTEQLGYAERIKFYSYAIGTRPGSGDIKRYTVVGNTHRAVIRNLDIEDGTVVYVSVKATDHAGLSTEVYSDEMTIDSTPPTSGKIVINGNTRNIIYIGSSTYGLILSGFEDDQSGIDYFELSIGSDNNLEDVQFGLKYFSDRIELELLDKMQDGHRYYISVKAVNRAGLSSLPVTASFIPDRSAPTGGHVLDGDWRSKKDLDFQKNLGYVYAHWKGFTDSQSGIRYYRAGLGTKPDHYDIEALVDVGLRTDIAWNGTYDVGKKYYVTVDACNGAGLCHSLSSDGMILDNSPPVHGIVKVGSSVHHHKYLPTGESVRLSWYGFEDPQSGIDHYEYCLGTKPLICDVLSFSSSLLQSSIIKTGLNLTIENKLYATIKAFNKAGLDVQTASDAFTFDNTPPVLVQKPSFLPDYNAVSSVLATQWDRSVLRMSWKFIDNESKVASHTITLKTHHEGHTPVEHIHVGNIDKLTISLDRQNWLHNGDKYYFVVTSCNTAGLCSARKSDSILIDATPPHQGGFKPPMTWHSKIDASHQTRSEIVVTWYGFVDAESPIERYFFTVSRNYSGHELSGGVISRVADKDLMEQNTTIMLLDSLIQDDLLILTIWAMNSAGLNSSVSRVTVNVLLSEKTVSSGLLELQKHSCDIHYCNKDCTCAVFGSPCVEVQINESCTTLNETEVQTMKLPKINVFGGVFSNPQNITTSSACLSGYWVPRGDDHIIQRYEWSMGIKDQPIGEGIFDLKSERPWKDVGKREETIYCLSRFHSLQHDIEYQIYVRAWYAWNKFAEFVSPPIRVDNTSPHHAKGKHIKDADASCLQDFDVIDWMDQISACWDKVFTEQQGKIIHYIISLGTSVNGSDIYELSNVGLVTNITLTNLSLSHGTRYYFTITAYNDVGLHTTLSSDGFIIDMDRPISGVVFNTDKHLATDYQSSATTFGTSWYGFLDHQSGIKSYSIAVVENAVLDFKNISFIDVGLNNKYTFRNIPFEHGKSYKGLVKAVDKAGHTSDVVSSSPKIIDATAPTSFECVGHQTEFLKSAVHFEHGTVSISRNISRNNYYVIRGNISGASISVTPTLSIDRFQTHLPIVINNNSSVEFQYSFLSPASSTALFNISVVEPLLAGNNYSYLMNVEISKCIMDERNQNSKGVEVKQIGPSRLAVCIKVMDEESALYKVQYGVGTTPGGFQIRPLTVVHGASDGVVDVDAQHGTQIFLTVLADNHAGLRSVFTSNPITIDKTPPKISLIENVLTDNLSETNLTMSTYNLLAKWDVVDQESGVKYCLCGIGKLKGKTDIEMHRLSDTNATCIYRQLDLQHGDNVFVSVKCVNNVELAAEKVSEKITVSVEKPENKHANIRFISPYSSNVEGFHQSENNSDVLDITTFIQTDRSRIVLEWTGFEDLSGIDYYEYRVMCKNSTIVDWKSNGKHTMAELNGLDLHSDNIYAAEARAVNSGHFASEPIIADMVVYNDDPKLTGKPISVKSSNQRLVLDWSDVFFLTDGISVKYDVTVGSKLGYSDILQLKGIDVNQYQVTVPKTTIITPNVHELFLSVTCTYSTGLFTLYQLNYKI